MRFLVDAQLSPDIAAWLRSRGHFAEHVGDVVGLAAPDRAIVAHAAGTGAVIVSKDGDFVALLERDGAPQLLWVRVGNTLNRHLLARLAADWGRIEADLQAGTAIVELT